MESVSFNWFDFSKVRLVLFLQPFGLKLGITTKVFLVLAIYLQVQSFDIVSVEN